MTFLPIVARELRVVARRPATYWSRMVVAAVMLVVASWVFVVWHRDTSAAQATAMFGTLAGGMVFVGAISGIAATADSLSSEKRDGTLGLLFLTPLRGYDVVLGKLCVGSLTVLYGMLGVTPILALPLLLGGVSSMEFVRMALLMVNTMLLSLSVGICISSISRDEKRARGAALLVMLAFAAGFPLVGAFLEGEYRFRGLAQWFLVFSPGYTFARAWDKAQTWSWVGYWTSMGTQHVLTWCFLLLACWLTPRTWQDRAVQKKWRWSNLLGSGASRGDDETMAFRRRLLDTNAFWWLTVRPLWRPLLVWAGIILPTALWLGFAMKYPDDMFDPAMFVVMALVWNGILKAWIASEATRQIAVDRKSGSIELLLSTALTTSDITDGLWRSLRRQFGGPLIVVLIAECVLLIVGTREIWGEEEKQLWVAVWLCGMGMLVADAVALYAVGLWQSAAAKGPAEAAGGTAFRVLALPWILYLMAGALLAVADVLGLRVEFPSPEWAVLVGGWLLIGLIVDLYFGLRAWRAVQSSFRETAATTPRSRGLGRFWGRLFGSAQPAAGR
ncbi:MAG: ABC transporter permease [Verrucomicrobia bacterium]|nr:ABC transporter permease [Verrucomicrobiota bacterium]